jgi:NAD-dependent deacetylase
MTSGVSPPRIVVLTGAGISAESGLPTFRGAGGLWEGHRAEEVATPEAFARDPALVHRFYNARRRALRDPSIAPNAAHLALAKLEAALPAGRMLLVTQNVDDLHERAGQKRLVHLHGEIMRARCLACGTSSAWCDDLGPSAGCPACATAGRLRPDIVWFGEMPFGMDEIEAALGGCDLFASIGTSGQVYPAAGFVEAVRARPGTTTIELNLEPSAASTLFHHHRPGPASVTVPAWVDELLARMRDGGAWKAWG